MSSGRPLTLMVSLQAKDLAPRALHGEEAVFKLHEVWRSDLWLLRHHPLPALLPGWCLLDSQRHVGGAMNFASDEAREWGTVMQRASQLVCEFTGCERIDTIAFGEGARHLHLISCSEDDPCATV